MIKCHKIGIFYALLLSTALASSAHAQGDFFTGGGGGTTTSGGIVTRTTITNYYDFPDSAPRTDVSSTVIENTCQQNTGGGGGEDCGCGDPDSADCSGTGGTGGSSEGGCFVTTAVVKTLGEADDGPTLTSLRRLRDSHTAHTSDGGNRIDVYYLVAPEIVRRIETRSDSADIWRGIHKLWISPIRTMVEEERWDEADKAYGRMVKALIWKHLILTREPMPLEIKQALRKAFWHKILHQSA